MVEIKKVKAIAGGDGSYNYPSGICYSPMDNKFYIADMANKRVCWLDAESLEGGALPSNIEGFCGGQHLERPLGVAISKDGSLYVADAVLNCIFSRRKDDSFWVPVVAQNASIGSAQDRDNLSLKLPGGVAVDEQGNLYTNDFLNNRICKVDSEGGLITLAGGSADKGGFCQVQIDKPYGIFYQKGRLYLADHGNNLIRYIELTSGEIKTIHAELHDEGMKSPIAVSADPEGNIYICEQRRMLCINNKTNELMLVLDRDIWKGISQQFQLSEKICHIGALTVPSKGQIFWLDTIKSILYHVSISF